MSQDDCASVPPLSGEAHCARGTDIDDPDRPPPEDIYNFLVNPANLASWTLVRNGRPEPAAGPNSWAFDGPRDTVVVHFTPANDFFVLDYRMQVGPQVIHAAHVRVIRNGAGTVLTHTSVQQPLVSDAMFASEEEWMMSDLLVLKTLMERS